MCGTSELNRSSEAERQQTNEAKYATNAEASFNATYKSIDLLLTAKLEKFSALKTLLNAEAKLSLGAAVLFLLGSIGLSCVLLTSWLLLNLSLGILMHQVIDSFLLSIPALFCLNFLCAMLLYSYLTHLRSLIGIPHTLKTLNEKD
jgi:hypothetical protein